MKAIYSKFFSINVRDAIKGLWTAVSGAVVGAILPTIQNWVTSDNWNLMFDWHVVAKLAVGAAVAYLFRKLLSNSNDQFLKSEASVTASEGGGAVIPGKGF
jgi:predicted oxidoreductase (fatty acid repression mutant protein)